MLNAQKITNSARVVAGSRRVRPIELLRLNFSTSALLFTESTRDIIFSERNVSTPIVVRRRMRARSSNEFIQVPTLATEWKRAAAIQCDEANHEEEY